MKTLLLFFIVLLSSCTSFDGKEVVLSSKEGKLTAGLRVSGLTLIEISK